MKGQGCRLLIPSLGWNAGWVLEVEAGFLDLRVGPEQTLCDGAGWGDFTHILGRTVGKSEEAE